MSRLIAAIAIVGTFFAAAGLFARDVPVPAGTLIQCTVGEPNFSPSSARVGDPVVCYARSVVEFGCSVFPSGTQLGGEFTSYRKPGRFHGKGWMQIEFTRLILPVGEMQLRARVVSVGGFRVDRDEHILGHGHPLRDAAGWAIPVLWPVKLVTLPMRGPEPALKDERVFTLRLMDDVTLPCDGFPGIEPGGWHYFGPSSTIERFPPGPHLQSFSSLEAKATRVFDSLKGASIHADATAISSASSEPPARAARPSPLPR